MQEESVAANSKRTADDENPVSNLLLACGAVFGDELTKNLKKKKEQMKRVVLKSLMKLMVTMRPLFQLVEHPSEIKS